MLEIAYWVGTGIGFVVTLMFLSWVWSIAKDADRAEQHLARHTELLEEQAKALREIRDALRRRG